MNGPIATIQPDPSDPRSPEQGMYLSDALAIRSDGQAQIEFGTIAEFDRLVEAGSVGYVMFGYFGYPRRPVRDMAKARGLVIKLLRQYEQGVWGKFRNLKPITPAPAPSAHPTFTLTEQLEALRKEAHTARRQGLTEVEALLKERACALAESYLDDGHMCDRGHWLNEHGQCETCLEAAQQLACARAHVDQTIQRWQFEAETTEVPF